MSALRTLSTTLLVLALGACGFHPMYETPDSYHVTPATAAMAEIEIRPIADADGVRLRQILREGLQPRGLAEHPRYELEVQMRSVTQELGVQRNATSTRANRIYTARFSLTQGGKRVLSDQVQSIVSYNIAD